MQAFKKTREEFFGIYNRMAVLNHLSGVKFAYAVVRIREGIKREMDRAKEIGKMSEGYQEYDKARQELIQQFADKDERGKFIIARGEYQLSEENRKLFLEQLEELKKEHPEAIAEFDTKTKEMDDFMKEEIELNLYTIKEDYLPENITVEQLDILREFIVEEK